jgi:hypothetical protein
MNARVLVRGLKTIKPSERDPPMSVAASAFRRLLPALLLLALLPLTPVATTRATGATTWTVSTTKDTATPSAAHCTGTTCPTLRDALVAAHSGDSISLASLSGTISLLSTEVINTNVTVTGPVSPTLTVKGNQLSPVFSMASGVAASVANLTMTNGAGGKAGLGGAFSVSATLSQTTALTLTNDLLTNNPGPLPLSTVQMGGGIYVNEATGGQATVVLSNTTVSHNSGNSGGGIAALILPGTQFTLTLLNSHVDSNASPGVGGITLTGGGSATVLLQRSTVNNNWVYSPTGEAEFDGIAGGMQVTATPLSMTLNSSQIQGNTAGQGLYLAGQGSLTLTNTPLRGNSYFKCSEVGTPTTPTAGCTRSGDLSDTGAALTYVHSSVGSAEISN